MDHRQPARTLEGVGLHSGARASVTLARGPGRRGLAVRRAGAARLPLGRPELVGATDRRTVLGRGSGALSTTEHLLAAVCGTGRWDVDVVVDGPEVPILDGSAGPFVDALVEIAELWEPPPLRLDRELELRRGRSSARARPCDRLVVECAIEFPHPAIGAQRVRWEGDAATFCQRFAPARTFGFVDELDALRQRGLIAGGSLDCALVFDEHGPINPPRLPQEPARHKLVDAVGDVALLGRPLRAELVLVRPSHALMVELSRQLAMSVRG